MTTRERPGEEFVLRVLAGGFYVSVWGLALAFTPVVAWVVSGVGSVGPFGLGGWAIAGWCGFTALFIALAMVGDAASRRRAGRPLERTEAGPLFVVLDDVASRLSVPPLLAVRVKPSPVTGVTRVRRPGRFLVSERRALVLGLPLMRALTVSELRAVVAHELAHLAGGDVRRGRIVNSAWRRIALMRTVLEKGGVLLTWFNPMWWFVRGYGALLQRGAGVVRRRQEVRADRLAASVSGQATYARALVKAAALGIAFRRNAPSLLVRAHREGRTITNFFTELSAALSALSPAARRRLARDALDEQGKSATAHPPLRERLASLGARRGSRERDTSVSAASLVPALDEIEVEMTPLVLRGVMLGLGNQVRKRQDRAEQAARDAAMDRDLEELEQREETTPV